MFRPSAALAVLVVVAAPAVAQAGMPRVSVVLTEAAKLRLEVISFFLVVLAGCAAAVRWLWNGLAAEFPRLPTLGLRGAAGLVGLWGAVFVLVLAMISGARELMTLGAWKPAGATYALADPPPTSPAPPGTSPGEDERRRKLDDLRAALWAAANDGVLPAKADDAKLPAELWQTAHASGMRYLYVPGQTLSPTGQRVVAFEPELFGSHRFALLSSGEVRRVTTPELQTLLAAGGAP